MTRETEWSDYERDKMLALALYESEICDCGLHKSIADTDPDLETVVRICPVCSNLARNGRIIADRDATQLKKRHGEKIPAEAPRPDDGRYLTLGAKSPDSVKRPPTTVG